TSMVVDPRDQSGNTIYLGAANGGVWKTVDGGANWTPLTDYQTDRNGNAAAPAVASLAISKTQPDILYAATGIADHSFDSRPSVGVLRTSDGGRTWTLFGDQLTDARGNPLTNFVANGGARVTKIAVDQNTPDRLYVAVASGGSAGPGLYKSED